MPHDAYIGLGGNQGDTRAHFAGALEALRALGELRAVSVLWCSKPLGVTNQADFLNAVALLVTDMPAPELLRAMQGIEAAHGRVREQRWGPRTLDLDLLLHGSLQLQSAALTLPHPELAQRDFVLWPLAEIAPDLVLPDGRAVRTLQRACTNRGLRRLSQCALG